MLLRMCCWVIIFLLVKSNLSLCDCVSSWAKEAAATDYS